MHINFVKIPTISQAFRQGNDWNSDITFQYHGGHITLTIMGF